MGRARTRLIRNLLYSLGLLAFVAGTGLGLPALNRALPANRPVPAGEPYVVGGGVSVVPPRGALLDVTRARPAADRGTALFLLGGVRYALVVLPFSGDLAAAGADVRSRITAVHGYQVTGGEGPTRTAAGVPGLQGGYSSSGRVGRYAVFVAHGTAVEITLAGTDLDVHTNLAALQASVATVQFDPTRPS